jgi:hypothetical protein
MKICLAFPTKTLPSGASEPDSILAKVPQLHRWLGVAVVAGLMFPVSVGAQGLDIERGLRIYQQIQDIRKGSKNDEKDKDRDRNASQPRGRDGGAAGLQRRVVGTWEQRSRNGRQILSREFGQDGRYVIRENGQVTERGRWSAEDSETLVLRPDGGRSPARLIVPRVDRSSMDTVYEVDYENDAQPQRWNRVSSSNSRPGTGQPSFRPNQPEGDFEPDGVMPPNLGPGPVLRPNPGLSQNPGSNREGVVPDGFYRSTQGLTIEVRGRAARVTDRRGVGPWIPVEDLQLRPQGNSRIRLNYNGVEQVAIRSRN